MYVIGIIHVRLIIATGYRSSCDEAWNGAFHTLLVERNPSAGSHARSVPGFAKGVGGSGRDPHELRTTPSQDQSIG